MNILILTVINNQEYIEIEYTNSSCILLVYSKTIIL